MTPLINSDAPDFWTQVASTRWGKYLTDVETGVLRRGLEACRRPGAALDIGAEQGRWTRYLIDRGWGVTSTDVCAEKLAGCQRHNPQAECRLVSSDDTSLPAGDESLDLVLSIETPVTERPWFVPELNRVLRDGGVGVFTMTNRSSYRGAMKNASCRRRGEEVYYPRAYRELSEQLSEHRLARVHQQGFSWLPFSRFSDSPLIPYVTPLERVFGLRRFLAYSPWVVIACQKGRASHRPLRPSRAA